MADSNNRGSNGSKSPRDDEVSTDDLAIGDQTSSASSRRKSSGRRSSTNGNRRSSGCKDGRRSSTSRSPRRSGNRRSSKSSSSKHNTTRDSKQEKEKLKLMEADGSRISYPPVFSSPGAVSTSSSKHSRSSHKANKTPDSKQSKGSKLEQLEMDGTRISSPPFSSPGDKKEKSKSSGSKSGRGRKSSKFSRNSGSSESETHLRPGAYGSEIQPPPLHGTRTDDGTPTLEATAAPDISDQIEAAMQQGREQGRQEEQNERKREAVVRRNSGSIPLATPALAQNGWKSGKYVVVVCFVLLLAAIAGVATWLLMPRDETILRGNAPPTDKDCLAVANGSAVEGQEETERTTVGVEIDLAVADTADLEYLKQELESSMQQYVMPLLVGCNIEGPVSIENNIYIIKNAVVQLVSDGSCTSTSSDRQCSIYVEVGLFPQNEGVSTEDFLDLIRDVFQDDGLLSLLNLTSPVEDISAAEPVEIITSDPPSPIQSKQDDENKLMPSQEPSQDQSQENICEVLADGSLIEVGEDVALQEYVVLLDVSVNSEADLLFVVTNELEAKIQQVLMPSLAGCFNEGRRLRIGDFIVDALVNVDTDTIPCLPESPTPCYRCTVELAIYIKSIVNSANFSGEIMGKFLDGSLVERLGLSSIFVEITVLEPTPIPSAVPSALPSASPTSAPVTYPTTEAPTQSPSMRPSQIPSTKPSPIASDGPTAAPTAQQTPGPTIAPTEAPTQLASIQPTRSPTTSQPSQKPSSSPSPQPSFSPTLPCFQSNLELRTAVNNWFDDLASVEAQYGLIGDWCFGEGVNSMQELFANRHTFNEDISNWDVSRITNFEHTFYHAYTFDQPIGSWNVSLATNMRGMFASAQSFNQNIENWDVSSVTTMFEMFLIANSFNQPIGNWDVSSVVAMSKMFQEAHAFNQPIGNWNVSSVTLMNEMFWMAYSFNQDLFFWDVSSVTHMGSMFMQATAFNQDISSWDVSSVTLFGSMFLNAYAFNQNLCEWGSMIPSLAVDLSNTFTNTNCPSTAATNLQLDPKGPFCHVCEEYTGNVLENSHYALYWPNPALYGESEDSYIFDTREDARAACLSIGLDLCNSAAAEGTNLCLAGYFSDTKGYWLDSSGSCGVAGFNSWSGESAGAYCCGRPHRMPDDGRPDPQIYYNPGEGEIGCARRGLQLCTSQQIMGYDLCAFGWLADGRGYYHSDASQCCCGGSGFNWQNNGNRAGAYCCVGY